jgi:predicted TIM-barrel fold metal-dependent hydrolase
VRTYDIISADSHLEIPAERWTSRVPERFRDRAPRRVRLGNGGDAWQVEGGDLRVCGLELCGKPFEDWDITGVTYEGSPGTGTPEQRLQEQDRDGVDAEVLFAGVGGPNFWRNIRDDEAYEAVIRAYNSFLSEEYCIVDPDRLIGLGVIPETGLESALRELRTVHAAGMKGITLNAYPSGRSYPTLEDDSFWREAIDLGMAITVHVALQFLGGSKTSFEYERRPHVDVAPGGRDPMKRMASWAIGGGLNAAQMTLAGVFERIPDLQIYFAESHAGWIPQFLEQFDFLYEKNIHWARRHYGMKGVEGRPSDFIRNHCHWGFLHEPFGVRIRHEIGIDKMMWANDFPHGDSDWPNSQGVLANNFKDVPDDERRQMVRDNAVKFFHLD